MADIPERPKPFVNRPNLGREQMAWARELMDRLVAAEDTIRRLTQNGLALGQGQQSTANRIEIISNGGAPFPLNYPTTDPTSWVFTKTPWDDGTTADGEGGIAAGFAHASGENSIAMAGAGGGPAEASGEDSIAIGNDAEAKSRFGSAFGAFSRASGEQGSAALSAYADAVRSHAIAGGQYATADEVDTVAIGYSAQAEVEGATAYGADATAYGIYSAALGWRSSAKAPLSQVFGYVEATSQERTIIAARDLEVQRSVYGDAVDYFNQWAGTGETGLILYSEDYTGWRITVDNAGVISATALDEWADSFWPSLPGSPSDGSIWVSTNGDGSAIVSAPRVVGYLSRSDDGGATWSDLTAAGSRVWQIVIQSDDGTKIFAQAYNGSTPRLYASTDSGATWSDYAAPTPFSGVPRWGFGADAGLSIITATANGGIWTSTDLGASWTTIPFVFPYGGDSGAAVSADGTTHYVTLDGMVAISTDSGVTWTKLDAKYDELRDGIYPSTFYQQSSIATNQDGSLVVVATNGPLLYSEDFGETWDEIPNSGAFDWISVQVSDDGSWIIAGTRNTGLYIGTTGGIGYVDYTAMNPEWQVAVSRDGTQMYTVSSSSSFSHPTGVMHFDTTTL